MATKTYVEIWSRKHGYTYVLCKSRAQARRLCEKCNSVSRTLMNAGVRTFDEVNHYYIAESIPAGEIFLTAEEFGFEVA